jgi:hypothetical protein
MELGVIQAFPYAILVFLFVAQQKNPANPSHTTTSPTTRPQCNDLMQSDARENSGIAGPMRKHSKFLKK